MLHKKLLQSENASVPLSKGVCSIDEIPKVFSHIKLLHVNARDLRLCGKIEEIESLVVEFDLDVICVSETFFTEADMHCQIFNIML